VAALQEKDILSSPVYSIADVVDDEGLCGEGVQVAFEHEVYEEVRTVDSAPIFWKGEPGGDRWEKPAAPAPLMGEHTLDIPRDLGYQEDDIDRMCTDGGVAFLP